MNTVKDTHPNEIRAAVLAASPAVRTGLAHLLQTDEQIQVAAEAPNLLTLQEIPASISILVIAGAEIENSLSTELIEKVWAGQPEQSCPALLILTEDAEPLQAFLEQYPAAFGLLPLESSPAELISALKAVHHGLLVGPRQMLSRIFRPSYLSEEEMERGEQITPRETEVLQLLANGLANKQIALALGISEHTAKFHISSIYVKLGAANRTEAVRKGIRLGLIVL